MLIWDSANIQHLALHDIDPLEAEEVIRNEPLEVERQIRNNEERILFLGETQSKRILFIVLTPRDGNLRIVTGYPAKKSARDYWKRMRRDSAPED